LGDGPKVLYAPVGPQYCVIAEEAVKIVKLKD